MCLGIPMQVIAAEAGHAVCVTRPGRRERVDTLLVEPVAPGDWLMVFLGAAREKIDAETARRTSDALEALEMAMRGEGGFDHLFADLIDREPQLPEFLRPQAQSES